MCVCVQWDTDVHLSTRFSCSSATDSKMRDKMCDSVCALDMVKFPVQGGH